jgi:hypothetical protein
MKADNIKLVVIILCLVFCCCFAMTSCVSSEGTPAPERIIRAKSQQDFAGVYENTSTDGKSHLDREFKFMGIPGEPFPTTQIEIHVGETGLEAACISGGHLGKKGGLRVKSLLSHGRIDLGIQKEHWRDSFFLGVESETESNHETLALTESKNLILVFDISTVHRTWGFPSFKTRCDYLVFRRIQ